MADAQNTALEVGGPGLPPQPWIVSGSEASYDGAILVPSAVPGGSMGSGTINTNSLYIKGVLVVNPVGVYLPLSGGTLTGPLNLLNLTYLTLGGGAAGNLLSTNGAGVLAWTNTLPGGPYLALAGGTLTGQLVIPSLTDLSIGGGTANQLLATNGSGSLFWATVSGGSGGGASVTVSDTPPISPTEGNLWFDSVGGQMYIWYTDVSSSQWVITNNLFGGSYLTLTGGTLTGPLILAADPTVALGAATKQYADTGDATVTTNFQAADTTIWSNIRFNNRIINGNMAVDQRNNGVSIALPTTSAYIIDRWKFGNALGTASKGSAGQLINNAPGIIGFNYTTYLSIACTTAYASPNTADAFSIFQTIEGYNFLDAQWGTPQAQPIVLEFWASGNPGTYAIAIKNNASTRSYVTTFTLAALDVWQKFRINIPGDTAGTWAVANNAAIISLLFSLCVGSTYQTSTVNSWQTGNFNSTPGSTNVFNSVGNSLSITGVALMVGTNAQQAEPEFRKYSDNLIDCQRYYQRYGAAIQGYSYATLAGLVLQYLLYSCSVSMRATPSLVGAAFSNISNVQSGSGTIKFQQNQVIVQFASNAAGAFYANATFTSLDADF